jgi:hypothetical protein
MKVAKSSDEDSSNGVIVSPDSPAIHHPRSEVSMKRSPYQIPKASTADGEHDGSTSSRTATLRKLKPKNKGASTPKKTPDKKAKKEGKKEIQQFSSIEYQPLPLPAPVSQCTVDSDCWVPETFACVNMQCVIINCAAELIAKLVDCCQDSDCTGDNAGKLCIGHICSGAGDPTFTLTWYGDGKNTERRAAQAEPCPHTSSFIIFSQMIWICM